MFLGYEDGRTDRQNTRCQVTWWPSQSSPSKTFPATVTGLVDSGQKTSEGHATHGIADQTPVRLPDPVQNDKTTSLRKPGAINKRNMSRRRAMEIKNKIQLMGHGSEFPTSRVAVDIEGEGH